MISKLMSGFNRARDSYLANKALIAGRELAPNLRCWTRESVSSKFLDVGCGVGTESIIAARDGFKVYALDLDKSQLLYKRDSKVDLEINLIMGDGQRLPFRDGTFDIIYCCHVLEHIPDDSGALVEMKRVLKGDGILFLSVPNIFNLSTRLKRKLKRKHPFLGPEHLREYSKDGLLAALDDCGLHIIGLEMTGFLLPLGNVIFNFLVMQFGLQNLKAYLAKKFPEFSESIDIVANKKGIQAISWQRKQVFPLPWWLRR